jgi:hypothetical protein
VTSYNDENIFSQMNLPLWPKGEEKTKKLKDEILTPSKSEGSG